MKANSVKIICAVCGNIRPHTARGLCRDCYARAHYCDMLDRFPRGRRAPPAQDRQIYWREYYRRRKSSRKAA